MSDVRDDDALLRRAVAHHFPPGKQQRAMALLASYGDQPHERELARVRFALVALSRGDMDALERLLALARRDYRRVLASAEVERDPVLGEVPRVRLLAALGVEEGAPGTGSTELGN